MTGRWFTPTVCVGIFVGVAVIALFIVVPAGALGLAATLAAISAAEFGLERWEATGWALPWDKPDTRFAKQHRPSQHQENPR